MSSALKATLMGRGYSSSQLDQWSAENPNDEGRANSAFPLEQKKAEESPASPGASAGATPANVSAGGGSPLSPGVDPSAGSINGLRTISGLAPAATPATPGGGAVDTAGAGGGGFDLSGFMSPGQAPGQMGGTLSMLRQGLGMRKPPQDSMALAGLRKAY